MVEGQLASLNANSPLAKGFGGQQVPGSEVFAGGFAWGCIAPHLPLPKQERSAGTATTTLWKDLDVSKNASQKQQTITRTQSEGAHDLHLV